MMSIPVEVDRYQPPTRGIVTRARIHWLGFVILLRPPRSILTGMNHRGRGMLVMLK